MAPVRTHEESQCSVLTLPKNRAVLVAPSDVHGLASGQKPSQAKPKVLAWSWLWPGLDFLKAKANGSGHGFELNILRK
jgi:hypothetical protein